MSTETTPYTLPRRTSKNSQNDPNNEYETVVNNENPYTIVPPFYDPNNSPYTTYTRPSIFRSRNGTPILKGSNNIEYESVNNSLYPNNILYESVNNSLYPKNKIKLRLTIEQKLRYKKCLELINDLIKKSSENKRK